MGKRDNTAIHTILSRHGKQLITACLVLLFTGSCGGEISAHRTTTATTLPSAQQIPAPAELQIELAPDEFHKLDFMTLHGCLLQTTLGKFQSLLGRYASASQRLLLNLEYLRLAPLCIKFNTHQGNIKLANQLLTFQKVKRQQLSSLIYNATLANTEYRQFWLGNGRHNTQPRQEELSLAAMSAINSSVEHWLSGNYRASNLEFEIQLSEVAKGHNGTTGGAELRQAVYTLEALLAKAIPTPCNFHSRSHRQFVEAFTGKYR